MVWFKQKIVIFGTVHWKQTTFAKWFFFCQTKNQTAIAVLSGRKPLRPNICLFSFLLSRSTFGERGRKRPPPLFPFPPFNFHPGSLSFSSFPPLFPPFAVTRHLTEDTQFSFPPRCPTFSRLAPRSGTVTHGHSSWLGGGEELFRACFGRTKKKIPGKILFEKCLCIFLLLFMNSFRLENISRKLFALVVVALLGNTNRGEYRDC